MKIIATLFLKVVLCLISVGVLSALIVFPQTEGRAANLDLVRIYSDPLIIYVYIAAIPFFIGLFQSFKLLNLIDKNKAFSQEAVNALKKMQVASLSLIGFVATILLYIRFFAPYTTNDDSAGPIMLGIVISFAFGVIATAAGVFQRLVQNAVDLKSENDLTV